MTVFISIFAFIDTRCPRTRGHARTKMPLQRRTKTPDKDPLVVRITATTARTRYGLTDDELRRHLKCELVCNPHYKSAAPMRLYLETHVEDLAARIEAIRTADREAADRAATAEAVRKAMEADERKRDAQAMMRRLKERHTPSSPIAGEDDTLPLDVLGAVMRAIAREYESDGGIVDALCISQQLATAALVCRDFRLAARDGFSELGNIVQSDPFTTSDPRSAWERRAKAMHDPAGCKLPDLKETARELDQKVSGTKAEVAARVLASLGLGGRPAPRYVPSEVIWSAWDCRHDRKLGSQVRDALLRMAQLQDRGTARHFPAECERDCEAALLVCRSGLAHASNVHAALRAHFKDTAGLLRSAEACEVAYIDLMAERRAQEAELKARCRADNATCTACKKKAAARECRHRCCGECCTGPCVRHRVP